MPFLCTFRLKFSLTMRQAVTRQLFSKTLRIPLKNGISTDGRKESSIHLNSENPVQEAVASKCPLHFLFGRKVRSHSEIRPTIKQASEFSSIETVEKQPVRARLSAKVYLDGIKSIVTTGMPSPNMHQIWRETFAKYGPSYTMFVGKLGDIVHLHRIEHAEEIVRSESKTPTRIGFLDFLFLCLSFLDIEFSRMEKLRKSSFYTNASFK